VAVDSDPCYFWHSWEGQRGAHVVRIVTVNSLRAVYESSYCSVTIRCGHSRAECGLNVFVIVYVVLLY